MANQIRCYTVEVMHYPTNKYKIYVIGTKAQVDEFCEEHTSSLREVYYSTVDYMVYGYKPFLRWIGHIVYNHLSPYSPWYDGPSITVLDNSVDLDHAARGAFKIFTEEDLR